MNEYNKLYDLYEKRMNEMKEVAKTLPFEDVNFYASFTSQMYYFLCHATRMLALSASRLGQDDDEFHFYLAEHILEEKHHERLAYDDVVNSGHDIEEEFPETAVLYQTQYYMIEHEDPLSLLGNILYLEGLSLSAGKDVFERVDTSHSEDLNNLMSVHTQEDENHIKDVLAVIEKVPGERLKYLTRSLEITHTTYLAMIERVRSEWEKRKANLAS